MGKPSGTPGVSIAGWLEWITVMASTPDAQLHARMTRTQDGLFKAEYTGEINPLNPDEREIPDIHLGTTEASVRVWVEEMAKGMGYRSVVWET